MDSKTTTSNSTAAEGSVVTKGFTQIALMAATGAFVAMRMNRGALLLSAGFAYAWWKKQHPAFEENETPDASAPQPWATKAAESGAMLESEASLKAFFVPPVSVLEPETAPAEDAWNDLRAAIAPVLVTPSEDALPAIEPQLADALIEDSYAETSIKSAGSLTRIEMELCQPSSPMVIPSLEDSSLLSNDILVFDLPLPEKEEWPHQNLFFEDDVESVTQPQSLGVTETIIVPKPITKPLVVEGSSMDKSLSAPIVVPRDLQARKSFFDWLRG